MILWFERPVICDVRARPHFVESTSGSRDLQMESDKSKYEVDEEDGSDEEEELLNSDFGYSKYRELILRSCWFQVLRC
ncbi:hypothetical protein A4A49_21784 [Nicotiana attenuata]|uniref:Uncharacterized protein n=1 Tax=Nicotiana attenuata TaxID=49451 RepID=A0A1J6I544_NICAT|nr:hypothetical protein A4A49_21784 [Nicotiana attenuata]